jgi:hypothetical protein
MFFRNRQKVPGVLVGDLLAISRGETLTKRRRTDPAAHHITCARCGYDRWDGQAPHAASGVRFAKKCYGPTRDEAEKAARAAGEQTTAAAPLVAELLELAQPLDGEPMPVAPPIPVAKAPTLHHFKALGTVK